MRESILHMKSAEPPNGDARSGKFRHWKLFVGTNHASPAFEKTKERRKQDLCIGCGKSPCECRNPKRRKVAK
jgi:hypothetical protein